MYTLLSIFVFLEWANWQSWYSCTVNCGYGTRSRYRGCQQCHPCVPVESKQCSGLEYETKKCSSIPCSGKTVKYSQNREIDDLIVI